MDIIPLGHSSFKLKGKAASVVCDPYNPDKVGLKFPKHTSAHIVTISHNHEDHNFTSVVEAVDGMSEPLIFHGPGEYEARGIDITGIATFHDNQEGKERGGNTLYRFDIDGVHIVHCGDLGHKLTDAQVELIDSADILLLPVGGFYTIDPEVASAVVAQLEPAIVIPMHFGRPELNQQIFSKLSPLGDFLKIMGSDSLAAAPKLTVTKDKLPQETQIVVLE